MIDWIQNNDTLLAGLIALSVFTFVGGILAAGLILTRLPADYFARETHRGPHWPERHPVVRLLLILGKNLLGAVLVILGLLLLLTPGQGLITLLIGISLLDFPGKYRLERRIVMQPSVLRSVNWLRRRAGVRPLVLDPPEGGGEPPA